MPTQEQLPRVEVAVAVIARRDRILAVWNTNREKFTLPMSKRRQLQDPDLRVIHADVWSEDAARAAAECTGRPSQPERLAELPHFTQSERDGLFKDYHYQIFRVHVEEPLQPLPGVSITWLTLDEFEEQEPVDPSARVILRKLAEDGKLPPW
jgi:hypothetical protein